MFVYLSIFFDIWISYLFLTTFCFFFCDFLPPLTLQGLKGGGEYFYENRVPVFFPLLGELYESHFSTLRCSPRLEGLQIVYFKLPKHTVTSSFYMTMFVVFINCNMDIKGPLFSTPVFLLKLLILSISGLARSKVRPTVHSTLY